jgi:hypothetical protein
MHLTTLLKGSCSSCVWGTLVAESTRRRTPDTTVAGPTIPTSRHCSVERLPPHQQCHADPDTCSCCLSWIEIKDKPVCQ